MSHTAFDMSEIEEVAVLVAQLDTVRASVGPWLAGFGTIGVRVGHNVIWVWSETGAFSAQRFDQRLRQDRISALRQFIATLLPPESSL